MALVTPDWKARFDKTQAEHEVLLETVDTVRNGQVHAGGPKDLQKLLRLVDSEEYESLLSELRKKNQELVEQGQELYQHQILLEEAHSDLQQSEKTVRALVNSLHDVALLTNAKGKVLTVNNAAKEFLGEEEGSIIGYSLFPKVPAGIRNTFRKGFHETTENNKSFNFEKKYKGQLFQIHMLPIGNSGSSENSVAIFVRDITLARENEQKLATLAHFDQLTGLCNRSFFISHQEALLSLATRNNHKTATLILDLDNFKEINDRWGHDTGDQLLQSIACRLKSSVRDSDIVARLGGDEFGVLLGEIKHPDRAAIVARKILDSLSLPHQLNGLEIFITCSIGIACYPECGVRQEDVSLAADTAMYEAKRLGRNMYQYYDPDLQEENNRQVSLVGSLRNSIKKRELSVVYQPKVKATTNEIVGVEALARWHMGATEAVSPKLFIPLAEEIGFIGDLGDWVIKSACETALSTRAQMGATDMDAFSVAVNVSMRELKSDGFLCRLKGTLKSFGLAATSLQIELPEHSVMEDTEKAIECLSAIRGLGVRIALDDFGTGYSSLSYLSRLPVDILKVDLSFVKAIGKSAEIESIIKSIINLAQSLGLQTVAEGVETKTQCDFLRREGCDLLQGYYFCDPVSQDDLIPLLKQGISGMSAPN